jgi:putative FmdB family regulatory protein
MPTYEYICNQCHKTSEIDCRMEERQSSIACPLCAGKAERIISSSPFHLGEGAWAHNSYSGDSNYSNFQPLPGGKKPKK